MRPLTKILENQLTEKEMELVPKSYDVVGSEDKAVVVIQIPEELDDKKKLIADAVMKVNKNVVSVLNQKSGRRGTHRLEELELVSGDSNTEVKHIEYGYFLKLDPQKVFFSPREATERQRVAAKVKPDETVVVFFSGVAPYPICIAKKQPDVGKIYSVEINPDAHAYAKENVRINKLSHKIILVNDDVRKFVDDNEIKFDRVVMPIAVGGEDFLDCAFRVVKDGGIIHFYYTGNANDLFTEGEKIVDRVAKENGKDYEIKERIKILPFSVRKYKICLDVKAGVG